jgi:hypothetical protein
MTAIPDTLAVASQASPALAPEPHPGGEPGTGETLYLIGRPPLKDFLRFVRSHAVNPMYEGELVEQWQAAQQVYAQLERDEPGVADEPLIRYLTPEEQPLLNEFYKDPLVRGGFNTVPSEVAMVELDRLVVYQEHIDLTFARQLEQQLGPSPSDDVIFRTCLPFDHPHPPVRWSRVHHDKFVFVSPSNDLRYLGAMPMQPSQIRDYPPPGSLVGVVGMAVGFGSNFLNALYTEQRLILNNGSHRAYTLRKMGVTHVPCIVQHVGSGDELDVVAASEIRRDRDLYLKQARPSMLRDYFNPKLHVVMPVRRRLRQVTVRFEVEEDYVPAL